MPTTYIAKFPVAKKNTYKNNEDGTTTLTIRRRNGETHSVVFDTVHRPEVEKHLWRINAGKICQPYVCTGVGKEWTFLHRLISGAPEDVYVGFIDHDTMNCRSENLFFTPDAAGLFWHWRGKHFGNH